MKQQSLLVLLFFVFFSTKYAWGIELKTVGKLTQGSVLKGKVVNIISGKASGSLIPNFTTAGAPISSRFNFNVTGGGSSSCSTAPSVYTNKDAVDRTFSTTTTCTFTLATGLTFSSFDQLWVQNILTGATILITRASWPGSPQVNDRLIFTYLSDNSFRLTATDTHRLEDDEYTATTYFQPPDDCQNVCVPVPMPPICSPVCTPSSKGKGQTCTQRCTPQPAGTSCTVECTTSAPVVLVPGFTKWNAGPDDRTQSLTKNTGFVIYAVR